MDETIQLSDDLWSKIDNIDGWLYKEEAEQLYSLCSGTWCEIGSWMGKSTIVLASKSKGYAVDWFLGSPEHPSETDTFAEFQKNTSEFSNNIEVVRGRMEDVHESIPDGLQLLFLDGEHSYVATKLAFELYSPKVASGGYVVLHDAWGDDGNVDSAGAWPEVHLFAKQLLKTYGWENVDNTLRSAAYKKI